MAAPALGIGSGSAGRGQLSAVAGPPGGDRAPCGAWLHFLLSREELGGMFLDLMAYLKPKGGWDKSMPLKPWSGEGIEQRHGEIRVTWQKLDCLKSNLRSVNTRTHRKRCLKPVPCHALAWDVGRRNLHDAGDAQGGHLRR